MFISDRADDGQLQYNLVFKKMKNLFYIFIAGFLFVFSCKKEATDPKPAVSSQRLEDSLFKPTATFKFIAPAGGGSSATDTTFYYMPASIQLNIETEKLVTSYEWYLRRPLTPDSLFSTIKNPLFTYDTTLKSAAMVLIVKNGAGADTISNPFKIKDTPRGLKIKGIVIDTMSFTNPSTSLPWNSTGGPNIFCQIYKAGTSTIVMDTANNKVTPWTSTAATNGWSSIPNWINNIYPVKKNLATTPYTIKYPTGIISFKISNAIWGITMFDSFAIQIFNYNASGSADLIGEAILTPSSYFGGVLPTTIYINNPSMNIYYKLTVQWL
jgi:hypothetical protein